MGRRRTVRKNNGHTRGSSLMYVVLLMTLLAVLSSGYMAISRYNMKAALNNRRYMEAQLSAKTIHLLRGSKQWGVPGHESDLAEFPGRLRQGQGRI